MTHHVPDVGIILIRTTTANLELPLHASLRRHRCDGFFPDSSALHARATLAEQ